MCVLYTFTFFLYLLIEPTPMNLSNSMRLVPNSTSLTTPRTSPCMPFFNGLNSTAPLQLRTFRFLFSLTLLRASFISHFIRRLIWATASTLSKWTSWLLTAQNPQQTALIIPFFGQVQTHLLKTSTQHRYSVTR